VPERPGAIAAWSDLSGETLVPLDGGLINTTWQVGVPARGVLQRLHSIFEPTVHEGIEVVTRHLLARGIQTPILLRPDSGELCHVDEDGACWRALSWLPGRTCHFVTGPAMAEQAGRLVGRWHDATSDLEHDFAFERIGAHDTDAHMATLREALDTHSSHRLWEPTARLAEQLLLAWEGWDGQVDGAKRIAHGDLKVSNLRFDGEGRGVGLLDLDTLANLPINRELGDAWRSWCNPGGEDLREARFELALFEASARGYLAHSTLTPEEQEALPPAVERICLELASRFASDALRECYFGWDPQVAPGRGEHCLLRAQGQVSLAVSVHEQRAQMAEVLRQAAAQRTAS